MSTQSDKLSLNMKRLCLATICIVLVMLVHGTITRRATHQASFGQYVEKKIGIKEIKAEAKDGVLTLKGIGTKQQREFAEQTAHHYIQKLSEKAINPPKTVLNEIQLKPTAKLGKPNKAAARRAIARSNRTK